MSTTGYLGRHLRLLHWAALVAAGLGSSPAVSHGHPQVHEAQILVFHSERSQVLNFHDSRLRSDAALLTARQPRGKAVRRVDINRQQIVVGLGVAFLFFTALAGYLFWRRQEERQREAIRSSREEAALAERARIAREVHDTLLQGLMSISLQAQRALKNLADAPEITEDALRAIRAVAADTTTSGRRAILRYRGDGQGRGIAFEIEEVAREAAGQRDITIDQQCSDDLGVPAALVIDLLSIVRQAVANAFVHGAEPVVVTIERVAQTVRISVSDAGPGFDPAQLLPDRHGIKGMIERAHLAQLRLTLPKPGDSRLTVEAPTV